MDWTISLESREREREKHGGIGNPRHSLTGKKRQKKKIEIKTLNNTKRDDSNFRP